MVSHLELRKKFADFWLNNGHVEVPGIPLVPQNDPTTLFTGSGMQQLVPNLLGAPHPQGTRLYNIQRCIRAQDIDEVGDNRHDTFFEMMGNWSLGDYFKNEQFRWVFDVYTNKEYGFGLDPSKLYVTVFGGGEGIPKDEESVEIWKELFVAKGIRTDIGTAETFQKNQHITFYDAAKNWWSRSGTPKNMPAGEVGGPDSEIFYDFGEERHFHETATLKDAHCNVNCDCGRFMEIGNSVFVQYVKKTDGSLKELPKKNVDFGGGFERVLAAMNDEPDVFKTDVFSPIVKVVAEEYDQQTEENKKRIRIIADHLRASTQLAADGILPSAKEQGYVMRSLIRRAVLNANHLAISTETLKDAVRAAVKIFANTFENMDEQKIEDVILAELQKYANTIENGRKIVAKYLKSKSNKLLRGALRQSDASFDLIIPPQIVLNGDDIFNLYQSTGVPTDEIVEMVKEEGGVVSLDGLEEAKAEHSALSRAGSEQKFKGGLADQSEQVVKYHTATHLLHQALCDVLGDSVRQEGSNITGERLRFDFSCDHKPTPEEVSRASEIVNHKIKEALAVDFVIVPKDEASKLGAKSFFKEKYPDMVKVYFVGQSLESAYSKEFCGGPHVANTQEIGKLEIYKSEKIGKDLYRIYAK